MPRIFTTTEIAKPQYYDRQALTYLLQYTRNGGPVGIGIVASYTAQDQTAAFIESIEMRCTRETASPGASEAIVAVELVTSLLQSGFVYQISNRSNTPSTVVDKIANSFGYLAFGDILRIYFGDVSAGGTTSASCVIKFCEYIL